MKIARFTLIFLLTIIFVNYAPETRAASIIAVCANNNSASDCAKNKLGSPTYRISNGLANFKYRIDRGTLGAISESDARSTAEEILGLWEAESSLNFLRDGDGLLEEDITSSNYDPILFPDSPLGYSPVVWDHNGKITDDVFGKGSKQSVLGFAGATFIPVVGGQPDRITESQAVFNGYLFDGNNTGEDSDTVVNTFQTTILHEFGHMFGLDHTQGGNTEGYKDYVAGNATLESLNDIPVMFPVAANPLVELQHDDIAVVKLAYPKGDEDTSYGSITGTLTENGEAILGASVVAYLVDDNNPRKRAVACPSDVDGQGDGSFVLPNLVPGNYIIKAEPIDPSFTSGSAVGIHEPNLGTFDTGFYQGDGNPILASDSLNSGINQALRVEVNAGETININFDTSNSAGDNNGEEAIEPSFITSGPAINKALRLRLNKSGISKVKIINLFVGETRRLKFSTDYPDLVQFIPSDTIEFSKRVRKVTVQFASFTAFQSVFPDIGETGQEIPVIIEDLDTGYIDDSNDFFVF